MTTTTTSTITADPIPPPIAGPKVPECLADALATKIE